MWSEQGCWHGQPVAGSLPVPALHNRKLCCTEPSNHRKAWVGMGLKDLLFPTYLDLTVQRHAAQVPWYVTYSDQLLLECLQLFPSQTGDAQLWQ